VSDIVQYLQKNNIAEQSKYLSHLQQELSKQYQETKNNITVIQQQLASVIKALETLTHITENSDKSKAPT
jgi:hypothetical protein